MKPDTIRQDGRRITVVSPRGVVLGVLVTRGTGVDVFLPGADRPMSFTSWRAALDVLWFLRKRS